MNILDIVNKDSEMLTLTKSQINSEVFAFNIVLAYGDLSKINEYIVDNRIGGIKNAPLTYLDYTDIFNKLNDDLKEHNSIRIWINEKDADNYLILLMLCNFVKEKDIYVVKSTNSMTYLSKGELDIAIKNAKKLSNEDIKKYSNEWNSIVKTNNEIRYLEEYKIIGKNYDDYTYKILNKLKINGEIQVIKLCGMLMRNNLVNKANELLYSYLIEKLINRGYIKIIKDGKLDNDVINGNQLARNYHIIKINDNI
ncbi:MAG: hypothetical protein IJZ36_03485 [Bacilli bacterium]|nr:hypothetical protein [Bacilli bacterium]